VIIWINGAFGVGKTSVAQRLIEIWPDGILFDLELLGRFIRRTVPAVAEVDYADVPLWRDMVVQLARGLDYQYDGPVVVPMSVWNREVHAELIGGLLSSGVVVKHFS
jgi:hypothetical protein